MKKEPWLAARKAAPPSKLPPTFEGELRSLLGEGFHTAFRKASDHPQARAAWEAIRNLPDSEYEVIIGFVVSGVLPLIEKTIP